MAFRVFALITIFVVSSSASTGRALGQSTEGEKENQKTEVKLETSEGSNSDSSKPLTPKGSEKQTDRAETLRDEATSKKEADEKVPAKIVGTGVNSKATKPNSTARETATRANSGTKNQAAKPVDATSKPATASAAVPSKVESKSDASEDFDGEESSLKLRRIEPKKLIETPSSEDGEKYTLKYKFEPGLVIASEVTHLAKTGTRIDSVQQDANSRTVSKKTWRVLKVENGEATFAYRIDHVNMSQQAGGGNELRYSSDEKEIPPPQFAGAADNVGKTLSLITIDLQGMVVARSDTVNPPHLGMGDVTVPLPKDPVAVGASWEVPRELRIQRQDGSYKLVKFREHFKLERVSAGVASIKVRSEPLTALTEPSEEAQVLQQLSNGTIRFDIDAGRMLSKELAWDHQVVGFSGAGSTMEYSARLEDQVVSAEVKSLTASKSAAKKR